MLARLSKVAIAALLGTALFVSSSLAMEEEAGLNTASDNSLQEERYVESEVTQEAQKEKMAAKIEAKIAKLQEQYDVLDNEELQAETEREAKAKKRQKMKIEAKIKMLQDEISRIME